MSSQLQIILLAGLCKVCCCPRLLQMLIKAIWPRRTFEFGSSDVRVAMEQQCD